MDARTINKIFKTSYCLGAYYKRFKILIVTEGGPDFSASTSDNTAAFREHLHRYQWILDAFDAAAKELGLSLGRTNRAEFFVSYNYYWCNTRRSEIPSDEKIDPKVYLTRLVENLNAGLILSAGGVGDERFRRNSAVNLRENFELPIFVAVQDDEELKEIFKTYLKNLRDGIDAAIERIAGRIEKGKSPLDVLNDICNNDGGKFNTFPLGKPGRLFPELLVVCEDPMNLADGILNRRNYFKGWDDSGAFNYITCWLHETEGMFPKRRVVLYTDKWTTRAYWRYENLFRSFAKIGAVKFEFYLYMLGAVPTKIKLPF